MKIFLTTFASSDLKSSVKRFRSQAEQLGIYDRIFIFNENDLNDDFNKYVSSLIKKGKKRGYGYFVWQCFFHKLVLNQINTNDIYHWCDVGCHFNYNGLKRLKEYINIVNNSDNSVLSFQYKDPDFKNVYKGYTFPNYMEYEYTKADLIKYFKLTYESEIINSPQIWGGSFLLKKNKFSEEIMDKYYNITRNRFDLIDDDETKFIEKNCPNYIQHRHPQSVLSILFKMYKCNFLSAYECDWALDENNQRTWRHLENFPILAKRDKKKNIFARFIDRQKRTIRRKKKS